MLTVMVTAYLGHGSRDEESGLRDHGVDVVWAAFLTGEAVLDAGSFDEWAYWVEYRHVVEEGGI